MLRMHQVSLAASRAAWMPVPSGTGAHLRPILAHFYQLLERQSISPIIYHSRRKSTDTRQTITTVKPFFISFGLATGLYTLFSYLWAYHPEILEPLTKIPFRLDFLMYLLCAVPIAVAGFIYGYKRVSESQKCYVSSQIDSGLYYLQLYTLVGLIYGPCIWDNITIIFRVLGPEHLDLSAQMEIQFIFVFFLTISAYRFFTILYVIVGSIFLFYVRKRSQILWVYLFFLYIYSSLAIGILFKLDIYPTSLFSNAIGIYALSALLIFGITFGLFLIIKRYKESDFK